MKLVKTISCLFLLLSCTSLSAQSYNFCFKEKMASLSANTKYNSTKRSLDNTTKRKTKYDAGITLKVKRLNDRVVLNNTRISILAADKISKCVANVACDISRIEKSIIALERNNAALATRIAAVGKESARLEALITKLNSDLSTLESSKNEKASALEKCQASNNVTPTPAPETEG